MNGKAFPVTYRRRPSRTQLASALLFLGAILAVFAALASAASSPARADSGGFPTRTPTVTPSPTVTPTFTSTLAPTLAVFIPSATPVTPTLDPNLGQPAIVADTPGPTPILPQTGTRPSLICWPFALLVLVIAVLVGSVLFGQRP